METANPDQLLYWNEQAGLTWAELQPLLDVQIAPLGLSAIRALAPRPGERILDIGCGCGDTSFELARHVMPGGAVTGLDISAPMLDVARARAAGAKRSPPEFLLADAQIAHFPEPFDAAYSRFGVMFFADPEAAFANIRAALKAGGRIAFVCWRRPDENPWMIEPLTAALRYLPAPEPSDPLAPGPFAFADAARIESILGAAGFKNVVTDPHDTAIGGYGLDQAVHIALRVGPLGRLLRENPDRRAQVADAVRAALALHLTPDGVRLPSATWIVTASN